MKALLVLGDRSNPNFYFFTRFAPPDPAIYIKYDTKEVLLVSELEYQRAQKESSVTEVVSIQRLPGEKLSFSDSYSAVIEPAVRYCLANGINEVYVEPTFPLASARFMEQKGIKVEVDHLYFLESRRRKRKSEIEYIRASVRAAEEAIRSVCKTVALAEPKNNLLYKGRICITSEYLLSKIENELWRKGYIPEDPIIAGGSESALPHSRGKGPLQHGLPIVIDIFPRDKRTHYYGDVTRTVVYGEPNELVQRMYVAVYDAQQKALSMLRPGVNARNVHQEVCRVLYEKGFGTLLDQYKRQDAPAYFIHGTGHGVGLAIHEEPGVRDQDVLLEPGDVITVEPGLYASGLGGVRIEDTVAITEDGIDNLTTLPKSLNVVDYI